MATPKKASSISLSATDLSDTDLIITQFTKAELLTWLATVNSNSIAVFFGGDGSDTGTDNRLVLAAMEGSQPSAANQKQSEVLPCPPYCNR